MRVEGDMRRLLSTLLIALAALWAAVGSAHAQKGTKGAEQTSSAYIECFKQHGAAYDSASKKWTLNTTELHSMNRWIRSEIASRAARAFRETRL